MIITTKYLTKQFKNSIIRQRKLVRRVSSTKMGTVLIRSQQQGDRESGQSAVFQRGANIARRRNRYFF